MKNKMKYLLMLFVFLFALNTKYLISDAANIVDKTRIGTSDVYWEIKANGTLKLTGNGSPELNAASVMYIPWSGKMSDITGFEVEESVTLDNLDYYFVSCLNLKNAPIIPNSVTSLTSSFMNCKQLTSAPVIPSGITKMGSTFYNCTSIKEAPIIPQSVTNLSSTFYNCTALKGEVMILGNPSSVSNTFKNVTEDIILIGVSDNSNYYYLQSKFASTQSNVKMKNLTTISTENISVELNRTTNPIVVSINALSNTEALILSGCEDIITTQLVDNTVSITPKAEGSGVLTIMQPATSSVWGNIFSVNVTIESPVIEDIIYSINNYSGIYDGNSHTVDLSVITPDTDIVYSVDGVNYVTEKPAFVTAGNHIIYYKIEKQYYNIVDSQAEVNISKAENVLSAATGSLDNLVLNYPESLTIKLNCDDDILPEITSNAEGAFTYTYNPETKEIVITPNNVDFEIEVTILLPETDNYESNTIVFDLKCVADYLSVHVDSVQTEYDGTYKSITVTSDHEDSTIVYSTTCEDGTWSEESPTFKDSGDYVVYFKVSKENYETVTGSAPVVIEKASNGVTVPEVNPNLEPGDDGNYQIPIECLEGDVTVESSDETVATADVVGNTIKIYPTGKGGSVTITVNASGSSNVKPSILAFSINIKATVTTPEVPTTPVTPEQPIAPVIPTTPIVKPTVKLNAKSAPLQKGKSTTKIKASGLVAGDKVVKWTTSNKKIATVNSKGKITAKKVGSCKITVTTRRGATATITIKVQKGKVITKSVKTDKSSYTLAKKSKINVNAVNNPITATEKITYKSSNTKIATVSKKGVVTAKKKGKCKITITSSNGKTKTVTIKVK